MKLSYLLKRLKFRVSIDGIPIVLKDLVFYNRGVILVEKDLSSWEMKEIDHSLEYAVIDLDNSKAIEEKYNLPLFYYYAQNNCKTLIATKDNKCLGFIRWTEDKNFKDLQKFGINLGPDEAYMFDFFIFPEYRGSTAGRDISHVAINTMKTKGISKYYGYFFSDNFPALWWHRTVCKTNEYKKIKMHKFVTIEMVDGKLFY